MTKDPSSNQILDKCSILCSEFAIKKIDEPFVTEVDNSDEWAL